MESFVDLNLVLPLVLTNGTLEDVQRLVASNLTSHTVFAALKQTKRYEALPALLPLLQLNRNAELCEDFDRIFAQAIADKDVQTVAHLQEHIGGYLTNNNIAFYYGALATSPRLPIDCKQDYTLHIKYQEGLISVDNLDLLLQTDLTLPPPMKLCQIAGGYCAKKTMDHFGYTEEMLEHYINGAVSYENQATIVWLIEKFPNREWLDGVLKYELMDQSNKETVPFIRGLLKQKLVQFTKPDWEILRLHRPDIYQLLQEDV